ncbi:MAG: hypothetical protein H7Y42_10585 [Chitinophagaceae bacterium]|nr:hypothetical protein [Chitinophagaceae bacterium]
MTILSIIDLIAPFHPVLVHLPIGILLLACFFQWLTIRNGYAFLRPAIPVALFWGMIGAVVSCITGYLLALSGEYDETLAGRHLWFGIAVAIFSLIMYVLHRLSINERAARWLSLVLVILIAITGHLGGTLTHGAGYLTAGLSTEGKKQTALKPIPNIQEAAVYADIVQPVLEAKCFSCHGPSKQKGKLRLDSPQSILAGGKDGKVLIPGKADESEMVKRILLPIDDDDHMPPKAKPQLTENEVELLQWWVGSGADFNKKVKELQVTEKVQPVLQTLQSGDKLGKTLTDVPEAPVAKADEKVIARLRQAGVVVIPVALNSNYLLANFITAGPMVDSTLPLLRSLKDQLIWLRLDNTPIGDSALDHVAALTSLRRIQLNNTNITDKGLVKLKSLTHLQSLNLVGTKISAAGLLPLQKLINLKNLYLYQTNVSRNDFNNLQKAFPSAVLDTGKYHVPTLAADTTEIKF